MTTLSSSFASNSFFRTRLGVSDFEVPENPFGPTSEELFEPQPLTQPTTTATSFLSEETIFEAFFPKPNQFTPTKRHRQESDTDSDLSDSEMPSKLGSDSDTKVTHTISSLSSNTASKRPKIEGSSFCWHQQFLNETLDTGSYKIPVDANARRNCCNSCYEEALAEQAQESHVCSVCEKDIKNKKWLKDPISSTKELCRICYKKALDNEQAQESFVCGVCGTDNINTRWYKDPKSSTKELCRICYDRARRALKQSGTIVSQ